MPTFPVEKVHVFNFCLFVVFVTTGFVKGSI